MSKAVPPLLMLAEGRRPRPRKHIPSAPKEITLHMEAAAILRKHLKAGWLWGHVPSGELRTKAAAAKLKRMGAPAGWADLFLFAPGGTLHCLELKRAGEDLSEVQEDFQSWCIRNAVPHTVARTMAEVLASLKGWKCLIDEVSY